jgi:hypothetical protein
MAFSKYEFKLLNAVLAVATTVSLTAYFWSILAAVVLAPVRWSTFFRREVKRLE